MKGPAIISKIRNSAILAVVASVLVLTSASPAAAHDSTDGSIVVVIDERRVVVTAPVAFAELGYTDTSGDGLIDADELAAQEATVAPLLVDATRNLVDVFVDGDAVQIIGAGVPSISEAGSDPNAEASPYVMLLLATGPHDGDVTNVELDWEFAGPSTTVLLSHADGAVTGGLSDDGSISFSLDTWSSAVSFFKLGIEHIQFGPDHLLFLLVLTLAAAGTTVTARTAWRTVKLVTAFTLGHAVSLALAYFDVISIPSAIVEPAISLSIVAAAVLVIRDLRSRSNSDQPTHTRPWLAAIIGLVHGLGFASNLGSLGVAASQRIAALAAFNLGIDIAQTVVVLLVIAALWLSGRVLAERTVWLRLAAASGAALFGIAWTASRLVELSA